MILADKIIENRKKNGWSQEELADKLGVSRQSVSKWESAQAVPDMKKILTLSEIFGVSTDYLLKDEIAVPETGETLPVESDLLEETVRSVSMEDADAFLKFNERAAHTISTGVMMCILSPVLLILLSGFAEAGMLKVDEDKAGIVGVVILLIIVAAAVAMFLTVEMRGKPYEFLEQINIDTEYGVAGMVKERRNEYAERHSRRLICGILLCVVSAIPLLISSIFEYGGGGGRSDFYAYIGAALVLVACACGVKLIVLTCTLQGGFDKLLEEGDYTRLNKKVSKFDGIYWAIVLAVYLGWSFVTMKWEITWIVWPIGGVLYAAYREILKAVVRARN